MKKNQAIKRHCICCEKELDGAGPSSFSDNFNDPPNNATFWRTPGNWGSTVFDDQHDTLEAYICDECLRAKAKYVYRFTEHTSREIVGLRQFNPEE